MEIQFFEVKTGKNKGFYFVENGTDEGRQFFSGRLAIIQEQYNEGFYARHRAKGKRIWGFSSETGHEYNREIAQKYTEELEAKGHTVQKVS